MGLFLLLLPVGAALSETPGAPAAASRGQGVVAFENSGAPAAQSDFLTGLAQLHNFEYPRAAQSFRRAQAADPTFAMAYWGEAMTYNHAVWMEQDLPAARAALAKLGPSPEGRAAKAPTPREKAYLHAVEILYGDGNKYERDDRYALAMEDLHRAYPDDIDATCFYALALLGTAHAGRDVTTYMKSAALMQEVFEKHPQHPGAAHYLIHSVDDSVHAPLGLRAARAYAKIAPDSPHALHMTSHIFLALGMWDDVVAANEGTVHLVHEGMHARDPAAPAPGCAHPITWLAYGYLQQGRFAEARTLVEKCGDEMRNRPFKADIGDLLDSDNSSAASFAIMRSRYLIDSQDWSGPVRGLEVNVDGVIAAELTRDFADAYGSVRYGKLEVAEQAIKRASDSERRFLAAAAAAGLPAESVLRRVPTIEQDELQGLLLLRRGRQSEAVAALERAAAGEKAIPMEYGPPSLDKPANELLGEVLLELHRVPEARSAFEAAQVLAPGRGQSLIGLASCAHLLKDAELGASAEARLARVKLREALASAGNPRH
jgi:tetratricopeptide (TPR) repeat protein